MIGDLSRREDELGGKMLLVVGLGQIGGRLAQLAKAFDMRVVGLRRDPAAGRGAADAVHAMGEFKSLLPEADFVALTCPLSQARGRPASRRAVPQSADRAGSQREGVIMRPQAAAMKALLGQLRSQVVHCCGDGMGARLIEGAVFATAGASDSSICAVRLAMPE